MLRVRVWTGSGPCCPRLWWGRGRGDACLVAPVAKDPWMAWAVRGHMLGRGGRDTAAFDCGCREAEGRGLRSRSWVAETWDMDVGGREHRWD